MSNFGKVETDVEIKAPSKFHEFWTQRPHHLSIISSDKIKGCNLHDDGEAKIVKELFEAVDDEKNSITLRVVEGELLDHYKSFRTSKPLPEESASALCTGLSKYEKVHGDITDPHTLFQLAADLSTDIGAHLSA